MRGAVVAGGGAGRDREDLRQGPEDVGHEVEQRHREGPGVRHDGGGVEGRAGGGRQAVRAAQQGQGGPERQGQQPDQAVAEGELPQGEKQGSQVLERLRPFFLLISAKQ